jgi:transcriptional regulator with XRE-family HTH domain
MSRQKIMDIETVRKKALAAFLKAKRNEYGWSQRELAQRINSTQNAVYLWETEKATADNANLDKIAALFGLKTWQLLRSLEDGEVVDPVRTSPWNDLQSFIRAIDAMPREDVAKIVSAGANKLAHG